MRRLEGRIGSLRVSVSVATAGRQLYGHLDDVGRAPASNEKLVLSMALLDRFGPGYRIPTTVASGGVHEGRVQGNLWLVGHGDPEVDAATLEALARRIRSSGVRRVSGSVIGDTSAFVRDRWAPGWHRIALQFISIPTALTFEANQDSSGFVLDPERRAAAALTRDLAALGVHVDGNPRTGRVPTSARTIAETRSAPLVEILRRQNVGSLNLDAEVLGKALGFAVSDTRSSIRTAASAIESWARSQRVDIVAHDASGLSYRNRVSTEDMVELLGVADRSGWGSALRSTLPRPGEGTLAGRLAGVDVRAKTGTLLEGVSALSGWVRIRGTGRSVEFSIMSRGLSKDRAVGLEDAIVRTIAARHVASP